MGCFGSKVFASTDTEHLFEEHDSFAPKKAKKVADVAVLLLFAVTLCGMGFIAFYSVDKGDANRFLIGVDSWGNVCGRKQNGIIYRVQHSGMDHSKRHYEFHLEFSNAEKKINPLHFVIRQKSDVVLCVEECPAERFKLGCKEFLKKNGYFLNKTLVSERICKENQTITAHKPLLNRCIPSDLSKTGNGWLSLQSIHHVINSTKVFHQDIKDLIHISLGMSFVTIVFFQTFTTATIAVLSSLAALSSTGITVFFWISFDAEKELAKNRIGKQSGSSIFWTNDLICLLVLSLLVTIFLPLIVFQLIFVALKRKNVVKILKEATVYIYSLPCIVLQPLITFVGVFAAVFYFLYIAAYILSLQIPVVDLDRIVVYIERAGTPSILLFIIHTFGCVWLILFFFGCQRVVFSGAISRWYFSRCNTEYQMPKKCSCKAVPAVLSSASYLVSHNLGSVAVGALLIPPFQMFRFPVIYSYHKIKRKNGKASRCFAKTFCCCMWWTKHVFQYLSRYNYVCMAIYGTSFWISGKRAVALLNRIRYMLPVKYGCDVCFFLIKITLVNMTALVSVVWFKLKYDTAISSKNAVILIIVCIASYIMTSFFINIYSITIDTMFLCHCDDKKRNNGTLRPFKSRPFLKKTIEKKRLKRDRWAEKSLSIPVQESNDSRNYLPPQKKVKRQRPRAAKGKRGAPGEIRPASPREPFSLDTLSWDGSVQMVVDRFDMFVDHMMHKRDQSPLNRRKQIDLERNLSRTPLPPITFSSSLLKPDFSSCLPPCSGILALEDLSDENKNKQRDGSDTRSSIQSVTPPQQPNCVVEDAINPSSLPDQNFMKRTVLPGCSEEEECQKSPRSNAEERAKAREEYMNPAEPAVTKSVAGQRPYLCRYNRGLEPIVDLNYIM